MDIRVEMSQLNELVQSLITIEDALNSIKEAFDNTKWNLNSWWQGKGLNSYKEMCAEKVKSINTILEIVKYNANKLNMAVIKYEEDNGKLINNITSLPTDEIK